VSNGRSVKTVGRLHTVSQGVAQVEQPSPVYERSTAAEIVEVWFDPFVSFRE